MSCLKQEMPSSQAVFLDDQPITVKEIMPMHEKNPMVLRIKIHQSRDDLPKSVIVKQQKDNGREEFAIEVLAYKRLERLQGKVIPKFFGEGSFNGRPCFYISEVDGITLHDLAKHTQVDVAEGTLKNQLENVFRELHEFGAEPEDLNLGNFLWSDGNVMVIDLEEIGFYHRGRPWECSVNLNSVGYLMSRFRHTKYPDRPPTPVKYPSIVLGYSQASLLPCEGYT
ncbi:hypothetical protein N7540_011195 [Penicillium herquei]|nr:hypothetical protein N7540_013240 [Penicillium herquei]KAJ6004725.1 hypothetical protein N7540_013094 [Penicillium herquei]KAJ6016604.1 hypothetical protein N7540_011195 [Penicillium herquei]